MPSRTSATREASGLTPLSTLQRLHRRIQHPIDRRWDAQDLAPGADVAIEVVDFAGFAAGQVLGRGRKLAGMVWAMRSTASQGIPWHRHPIGRGDGKAFLHHVAQHGLHPGPWTSRP